MGEYDIYVRYYLIARNSSNKPFQFAHFKGKNVGYDEIQNFYSCDEALDLAQRLRSQGYETHLIEDNTLKVRRFITLEAKVEQAQPKYAVRHDFSFLNLFRS